MIDQRHAMQLSQRENEIRAADWPDAKVRAVLIAAAWAMADEFPDTSLSKMRLEERKNIPFFCDCVRHYWARQGSEFGTSDCTLTHHAHRCPHSDTDIPAFVACYERHGGHIWQPAAEVARAQS